MPRQDWQELEGAVLDSYERAGMLKWLRIAHDELGVVDALARLDGSFDEFPIFRNGVWEGYDWGRRGVFLSRAERREDARGRKSKGKKRRRRK